MENLKYKRVLLKVSGEALAGNEKMGINYPTVTEVCKVIKSVFDKGAEISIVVGGGNFWRGRSSEGMDRTTADHMGMLATVINSLALQDALESIGIPVRVQTAIEMSKIAEPYIRRRAIRHIEKNRIVIFACGTGNPFFTTDTAAALRAAEIEADVILKATKVDGVYDKDPNIYNDAKKHESLSYMDVLKNELKAMDATATSLCMDNDIPILVFNLDDPKNIEKAILGEKIGTLINKGGN